MAYIKVAWQCSQADIFSHTRPGSYLLQHIPEMDQQDRIQTRI